MVQDGMLIKAPGSGFKSLLDRCIQKGSAGIPLWRASCVQPEIRGEVAKRVHKFPTDNRQCGDHWNLRMSHVILKYN
jgi:hypothetical protein